MPVSPGIQIIDQTGRQIEIIAPPLRVVSLVPSLTELLCALGLEDLLVGVTRFCTAPAHIRKDKKIVGGTKKVHTNRIFELKPDLILCNKEENTPEMVADLSRICPVHVSDIITLDHLFLLLEQYGTIFRIPDRTAALKKDIQEVRTQHSEAFKARKPRAAYFIWKDPWMLAGGGTFINTMLAEGGFVNIAGNTLRYPMMEDILPDNTEPPELVFLSSEPFPFQEKHKDEVREFFPESKVVLVDGSYFSWYGARLTSAYPYMAALRKRLGLDKRHKKTGL
ncbi:ABC transporter substrate-binding protein [Robertkochia flava]|uniref:ABC transporter substrate-binding protein n=1 Tax=Robertkochia flava TaxID=3447986 RepID=UPI001CCBE693|nr:helical backbone metal receptor [Robertkochia marina]